MMVNMGTVWDRATEFLSDNLSAVVPIALLAIFVPYSVFGNLMPLVGHSSAFGNLTYAVILLVLGIAISWGGLAITALALDPVAGRNAAAQAATNRLLPMLGIKLLYLGILIVLLLPVGIGLAASGIDLQAMARGGSAAAPAGNGALAMVALYLPVLFGLYLFIAARLLLLDPVIVAERRGVGALTRSFALTRGITWKVIGVVILYFIVSQVAQKATQFVFGSILGLVAGGEGQVTVATVLTSILVAAVTTAFAVLASAFVAKLYLAVRDAREAIVEAR
jgi:hypothetical protein